MKHKIRMSLILLLALLLPLTAAFGEQSYEAYQQIISTYSIRTDIPAYADYLASHPSNRPDEIIVIDANTYTRYEESGKSAQPVLLEDYADSRGVSIQTGEDALISWRFTVPESGLYDLTIQYYPEGGKGTAIQRAVFLDGMLPYKELSLIELARVFTVEYDSESADEKGVVQRAWQKDNQGNDLKPTMVETPEWMDTGVYDVNGYIGDQLSVYLTAGEHELTLISQREPLLLRSITFQNTERPDAYTEVKAAQDQAGAKDTSGVSLRIEAENMDKVSSQMLYPVQDSSSAAIYPISAKYLLNNAAGGNNWKTPGQWMEWQVEVPEDGYYCLTMHNKQNYVRGINVFRRITVDGEVPFAEFAAYPFAYSQSWRMETLSDASGEPYRIYLTKGVHTLRMEVVLGDMADIIRRVEQCVLKLNAIYRKVIYITGVAPDEFRDYQLTASLPDLESDLIEADEELKIIIGLLEETAGTNSDKLTVMRTMHDQLLELIEDQERFTAVLSSYKTNVRACGNWITQVREQPLRVDRLYLHSPDVQPKAEHTDIFSGFAHEVARMYNSFVINYNQVGNVADEGGEQPVITLWIGTGRDQANVIKSMIDEEFTPNTGVAVNVQLVDMNTLLRATLSGQGPDVAIQVSATNGIAGGVLDTGNDTPINYGLRHAVLDLTQFEDYEEVAQRFADSAIVPFRFNGAVYALPDTQTFPMLFYRKDILAELGLEVPQTWDDVKVAMSVLSKNQMEFGMLPGESVFAMLLFQNGGKYYNEGGISSALDSDVAVNTFKKYCEYYTDYKLDKDTSTEERFRTGECPLIISSYTTYNNLQVSAPDIAGLWDFTQVPGTVREDGTISRATGSSGLADIIMSATEYPQECWEFLKWWTSASTQTRYGREMESLMGPSARVATANKEALANLAWPLEDLRTLQAAMEDACGIEQVPGGYYTWRNVSNAFYAVVTDVSQKVDKTAVTTPREELMDKVLFINAEIDAKRQEFGLPIQGE